jgi:hypothetical protein
VHASRKKKGRGKTLCKQKVDAEPTDGVQRRLPSFTEAEPSPGCTGPVNNSPSAARPLPLPTSTIFSHAFSVTREELNTRRAHASVGRVKISMGRCSCCEISYESALTSCTIRSVPSFDPFRSLLPPPHHPLPT